MRHPGAAADGSGEWQPPAMEKLQRLDEDCFGNHADEVAGYATKAELIVRSVFICTQNMYTLGIFSFGGSESSP